MHSVFWSGGLGVTERLVQESTELHTFWNIVESLVLESTEVNNYTGIYRSKIIAMEEITKIVFERYISNDTHFNASFLANSINALNWRATIA